MWETGETGLGQEVCGAHHIPHLPTYPPSLVLIKGA
jgi:hypothetical protein